MRMKLLILSIIGAAGFSFAADAVLFGNVLETDLILTPEGVTNAILATALTAESDPVAYPVATNALATATNALAVAEGALTSEADTLATVTARGSTTTNAVTIGSRGAGTVGVSSFTHGYLNTASGYASHAQGYLNTASGDASHAEGVMTTASGYASHAQGDRTTASGNYSHAQGNRTTASGDASHASGLRAEIAADHDYAFAWQGSTSELEGNAPTYYSHGPGTFNINPVGGLAGFYVGETNMATTLSGYATTTFVAETKWQADDIATNLSYNVVVSNGHWIIRESLK